MGGTGGTQPETVICRFQVRADREDAFRALLRGHWSALREAGLVTDEPPQHLRGLDEHGQPVWIEIFTWVDGAAAGKAHTHPVIGPLWASMEPCVEERAGSPRKWQFPHYHRQQL